MAAKDDRSEAALERATLIQFSQLQRAQPDMICTKVEVGTGFRGTLLPALQAALAPFGKVVVQTAMAELKRHYLRYGEVGFPDLAFVVGGHFAGVELKKGAHVRCGACGWEGAVGAVACGSCGGTAMRALAAGELSDQQKQWHDAARKRGAFVMTLRDPADLGPALDRARRGAVE